MRTVLYFAELALAAVNFVAVYAVLTHFSSLYQLDLIPNVLVVRRPAEAEFYVFSFWVAVILWAAILRRRGEYHQLRFQTYHKVLTTHVVNACLFFGFFTSIAFVLKFHFLSRLFIIVYTVTTVLWLLLLRLGVLTLAFYLRSRGLNYRNLILVGTGGRAQEFIKLVAKHSEWGYRIIGLLDVDEKKKGVVLDGVPVIGTLEDLPRLLDDHVVDEVVFVVPRSWLGTIEKCILYCEAVGVPATLSTDFFNLGVALGKPKTLDNFTYLTFETRLLKASELIVKRATDIAISFILLIVLLPVFFVVAMAVKFGSPGSIFFRQIRIGRNGRRFVLYKFRSMVTGAEERIEELKGSNEMTGPVFKMTDDPRVTRVGRFLRKSSLDELPQIWNVLKSDMSLVGPRPPLPNEVEQYEPWQRRRLSMKPGITCIWQVSGRNDVNFEDWMKLDLHYIDHWTLWLDFKIIFQTIGAVLTRSGAR